ELVAMAGGENLFGTAGSHSPWMEWEDLKTADPDVIVVMPCGFDIARSRAEMPALIEQSGWENLAAVKSNQVFLTDGNQYFNRPGPRVVESLEILTEVFHPKDFTPTHLGRGWEQF
ncbi:MAG TPA: cobalamin-binding protein, partial [Rhodospirillaceae bacterium]|nr:cobalamin-binding protein [Rhodospirillaceae bacterium]